MLEPIQQKYREIRESGEVPNILRKGAEKAAPVAEQVLRTARERMGFLL